MIIESSIKLRLGARVEVLQLVYANSKLIREEKVYGWVVRPASREEYMEESHAIVREDKYFYYEVRLEAGAGLKEDAGLKKDGSKKAGAVKKGNPKHNKQRLGQKEKKEQGK